MELVDPFGLDREDEDQPISPVADGEDAGRDRLTPRDRADAVRDWPLTERDGTRARGGINMNGWGDDRDSVAGRAGPGSVENVTTCSV